LKSAAEHKSFESADLQALLHRLNNQLGIILANAELLEAKADAPNASRRAAEVSGASIEAMRLARAIGERLAPHF
jgi:hypothetical protein